MSATETPSRETRGNEPAGGDELHPNFGTLFTVLLFGRQGLRKAWWLPGEGFPSNTCVSAFTGRTFGDRGLGSPEDTAPCSQNTPCHRRHLLKLARDLLRESDSY